MIQRDAGTRRMALTCAAGLAAAWLAGCSSDDSGTSGTAAYCQKVRDFKAESESLDSVFTGEGPPTADAVKTVFTKMQDGLHRLATNPPADIKADVDIMTKDIDTVVSVFTSHDWDVETLSSGPDAETLQKTLDDPAAAAASDHLKTWSATNCGITDDTSAS